MKDTPKAGIYVRISSDVDGTGLGVARQLKDCEALAKKLGWSVVEVYEDNDVSASKAKPRPGYERMLADVKARRLTAVVVWDVDRLTRRPRELEDWIDEADKAGLKLASVGGDIDLATEQGRMLARMKGTVARYEVEQASRRLRNKHAELAASGKHVGPRPFGWDFAEDRRLVVNHAEAVVLLECVERVLAGEGMWRIRNDLNARGIPTSTGGQWQTQPLRRMLLRWRNCGVRSHKGREVGPGEWDAIVDRDTHERVVATLTDPARRRNNRGTAVRYLLTNIATCGACGRPVVGTAEFTYEIKVPPLAGTTEPRTRTRHYPHSYKCPHAGCMKVQRNMAEVDAYVEGVIVGILERDGVRVLGGDSAAAEAAGVRIQALEAKLALAADEFAKADGEAVATFDQLKRITEALRPQLEAEREKLRRSLPEASLGEFAGLTAGASWNAADVEIRRKIIDVMGISVTIDPVGSGRGKAPVHESVRVAPG